MVPALITSGTFIGIALAVLIVGRVLLGGRNRPDAISRKRSPFRNFVTTTFATVIPTTSQRWEEVRADVIKAGYYHRRAAYDFFALRNVAVIGWLSFIAAAILLLDMSRSAIIQTAVGGTVILILLYAVPSLILGALAKGRVQRIQYALPDALDMVNMMVTGGLPVRQSIERVSEEIASTHPDLACELAIVNHQSEAGSLDQALKTFAKRIDVPEVIALSTMARHADRLGGNVATAFRDYSDSIRRERRQRAEERGNKAAVKIMFPMVLFLAPPIYVLLLGPAVLELRTFMVRENQAGGILSQEAQAEATGLQRFRNPSDNEQRNAPVRNQP